MTKKIAIIGTQTGDEGKGVRVDYYAKKAVELHPSERDRPKVWTMRWQGGANAGHTVYSNGERYALHQVPSGILIDGTFNLMGEGVFLEPRACLREVEDLRRRGVKVDYANFGIASNAHVTLDYHIELDAGESRRTVGHTSTGRGVKPTAIDKYGRVGIRFAEFLDRNLLESLIEQRFPQGVSGKTPKDFVNSYLPEIEGLREFLTLQERVISNPSFKVGIGEGAQGFMLDIDRGLYPGVTSSNPTMPPFRADKIVGVVKSYASSIGGDRPFVGKMAEDLENLCRDEWGEKGTTTGKPRSLGWLDIVALRHAIRSADVDCLISTCGDRLEYLRGLGELPKLVVAYKIGDKSFTDWDASFHKRITLNGAEPEFEEFEPWNEFFDKKTGKLSDNAQRFMDRVEYLTGVEFVAHGTGPGIDDVLELKNILE